MFQSAGGLQSLLKEGSRHYSGLEEAMLKNIDACKQLSTITRTSLGPHGMNKMVINAHEKLFVTSDAATILKELEVVHPAAKLLVLAAKMQESEVGDGTNLVVVLAGELLTAQFVGSHNFLSQGLRFVEAVGVKGILRDQGIVRNHHSDSPEQGFQVVRKFRASSVAGVHGDEHTT